MAGIVLILLLVVGPLALAFGVDSRDTRSDLTLR
jgi:hypothetical protein